MTAMRNSSSRKLDWLVFSPGTWRQRPAAHGNSLIAPGSCDLLGLLQNSHIRERIAGDHDDVGELAFFNRAEVCFAADAFGGPAGRRAQRLQRRHPGPNQAGDFDRVVRMPVTAGVSARGDLDPGSERLAEARDVMFFQLLGPFADMRLRRFAVKVVDRKRRHKKDALARHHVEQFRLLVEIAAMVDRIDPGLDGNPQPAAAERMTDHAAVKRVCLLD
jgi:hypothetical protein